MEKVVLCSNCDDPERCLSHFRSTLNRLDLVVAHESSLASIPGSVHLHFRPNAERKGTLEYTMDTCRRLAWLSWHANRYGPWIDAVVETLSAAGCSPLVSPFKAMD